MATVIHSASAQSRANAILGLRPVFERIAARWQAYRRRSQELNELFGFDERELRDVGLTRSDLRAIEKGSFHRD